MITTLIINAYIVTMDADFTEYPNGYLAFNESGILSVGTMDGKKEMEIIAELQLDPTTCKLMDVSGDIVIPGLINLHTHAGMIPFRSLADDYADRLYKFLLPLEQKCMTSSLAASSTQWAIAEMLQSGITTFVDMYYFAENVAVATEAMGIRAFIGETIMSEGTCDQPNAEAALAYTNDFIVNWKEHPLVQPFIAPHAPYSNTSASLQAAFALAKQHDVLFSLHASEMDFEMEKYAKEYQQTPIAYLDGLGVLDKRTLLAHCIHTTSDDHAILAETGTSVAHCPGANMKSGKGIAAITEMQAAGITVGIGTDGPASNNALDIFSQMQLAAKAQKTKYSDRTLAPCRTIFQMATRDAAKALGMDAKIGSLEAGKAADITIVSTKRANMFPIFDIYAVLVYSAQAADVEHVFVNGVQLLQHKELVQHDVSTLQTLLTNEMKDFVQEATKSL